MYRDEDSGCARVVTIKVPKDKGKTLVSLIDDAVKPLAKDK